MALGGGNFTTQNKVLPGTYINFVSAASATARLSDRGIATMPLELDWGPDEEVFEVSSEAFRKDCRKIFGYFYEHEKMKGLRDLFLNIHTLYAYKLTSGGVKASNDFATARYCGIRGNDLKLVIRKNAGDASLFEVRTYLDTSLVDEQSVAEAGELKPNDYVDFKNTELAETASAPLTGGTNGTADAASYQKYLDKMESYSYNVMGITTADEAVKTLAAAYCKRLREEIGLKFQLVLYRKAADYPGVISVRNKTLEEGTEAGLVYWVTGITAGCAVNQSNQNRSYDGEFVVAAEDTQAALIQAIQKGEFTLHKVGSEIRVLEDINSMVTTTDTCGDAFKENQTIRVCDQIANDIAVLFRTKYLGTVPNDAAGRISLWSDIVKHHEQLQDIRAIEGFSDSDVKVEPGATKKSVVVSDAVTPVNAMGQLYMSVLVQ